RDASRSESLASLHSHHPVHTCPVAFADRTFVDRYGMWAVTLGDGTDIDSVGIPTSHSEPDAHSSSVQSHHASASDSGGGGTTVVVYAGCQKSMNWSARHAVATLEIVMPTGGGRCAGAAYRRLACSETCLLATICTGRTEPDTRPQNGCPSRIV